MNKSKPVISFLFRYSRLIILLLVFLIFTIFTDTFFNFSDFANFTKSNIYNIIAQQVPFLIILSIGMTIAIILKGIDLSMGTVLALSSCLAALVLKATGSVILCLVVGLTIGLLFGLANGVLIAKVGLSPYISTYTIQWVSRGIAYVVLAGTQVFDFPLAFRNLFIGWEYTLIMIAIIVAVILWFVMSKSNFGRSLYMVGSNREAAQLSGINTSKVITISFSIIGVLAALAGLMYIANLGAAEPVIGANFPIRAIAATLIGGASFGGGKGSVVNSIIGVFIMIILENGLLHMNVHSNWQEFAIGIAIVLSIILEKVGQKALAENKA